MYTVPPCRGVNPQLLHNLNQGPNLRSVAHAKHEGKLPDGWRLSFGRVAPAPLRGDFGWVEQVTATAFYDFERACAELLSSKVGRLVGEQILAGVATTDRIRRSYLGHPSPFSVRRLDIVVSERGPVVCENDEMPGGLVHAYWLDHVYGINQPQWRQALQLLTAHGPLVFAVSTQWSAPYLQEITWFAQHLTQRGFNAYVVTDRDAHRLDVGRRGVRIDGKKVGTVWRLFPVFEAHGAFSRVVEAANHGRVRLVPELASWGNKAWMGIFWEYQDFFRQAMHPTSFALLGQLIPYSRLVGRTSGFPTAVRLHGQLAPLDDLDALRTLPNRQRKHVVVKTAGAHDRAARSHGVAIGGSVTGTRWGGLLDAMLDFGAPLVVQEYHSPKRVDIPVVSVLSGQPQLENPFTGKLLIRPWVIEGRLVSATAFFTAPDTSKLHGTTTGAEIPLDFG